MSKVLITDTYLTNIADSIRAKNGTQNTYTPAEMSTAIDDLPAGGGGAVKEKDVNFWDYDGTLVASYTAEDFADLNELPNNPSHSGLTAQGWDWTLAGAKTYVASYGGLDIGQTYITDDNSTRIYIELIDGALQPYLGFAINGTATIDWGDGNTETATHTSTTTIYNHQHTYATPGKYVISLSSTSDIYFFGTNGSKSRVLWFNNTSTEQRNMIYQNAIYKLELGANVVVGDYAFATCRNLESVTIPSNVTSLGTYAFSTCYKLEHVNVPKDTTCGTYCFFNCFGLKTICMNANNNTLNNYVLSGCYAFKRFFIPSAVTTIGTNVFNGTYLDKIIMPTSVTTVGNYTFYNTPTLREITLGENVTSLGTYMFQYDYALTKVVMPKNVSSIGAYAFNNCYALCILDFSKAETIPSLANTSNVFTNTSNDLKIIVPDALYDTWIATTNWSSYASKIVKASQV